MRTVLTTLTVLMVTLGVAFAQAPAKDGKGPHGHDDGKMVEKMTTELGLSDEQVEKLTALHDKHMAERETLKSEREEYKDKKSAMQEKHLAELKEILTEEQYNKFLELKAQKKEQPHHCDGHHGSGNKGGEKHECGKNCSKGCDHKK